MAEKRALDDAAYPLLLSLKTHHLEEMRRSFNQLGFKERWATRTSVHFDLYGCQLTLNHVKAYTEVPVPHFGFDLDEKTFLEIATRLVQAKCKFILFPHKRSIGTDREHWVMGMLDPFGNAIKLKSTYKTPRRPWTVSFATY